MIRFFGFIRAPFELGDADGALEVAEAVVEAHLPRWIYSHQASHQQSLHGALEVAEAVVEAHLPRWIYSHQASHQQSLHGALEAAEAVVG